MIALFQCTDQHSLEAHGLKADGSDSPKFCKRLVLGDPPHSLDQKECEKPLTKVEEKKA